MKTTISVVLWFIYYAYCEEINRNTVSDSSAVSCNLFPCIINCNAQKSCFQSTISCPSTGKGDCTINLLAQNTAQGALIIGGSSTNIYIKATGFQAFYQGSVHINDVNDLILVVQNAIDPFREAKINVDSVEGNLQLITSGNSQHAFWKVSITAGFVGGGIEITEDTYGNNVNANFLNCFIHISGDVAGDALFQAVTDNNYASFAASKFIISGTVYGDLTFSSNSNGAFSSGEITVDTIKGEAKFIGESNTGGDFKSTAINIENCPYVSMESTGIDVFRSAKHYFGSGVGFIDVTINGGTNVLYTTVQDARYADEIVVHCNNNAGCNNLQIKCPEDNKANKCRVYCSSASNCNDIDLFTTNGYCIDASVYCLNPLDGSKCTINTATQIFCTEGTSYQYGARNTYCDIRKKTGDYIFCQNYGGAAKCSTGAKCDEPSPTPKPTEIPTTATPTTYVPTVPTVSTPTVAIVSTITISPQVINRNTVSDSSAVSCNLFPCIINCNAQKSCFQSTISCPSTGSGDCTINLFGDNAAQGALIKGGSSTNI
eukprot:457506_1